MPDKVKLLYDTVSRDYDVGTYEQFSSKLQDEGKRKAFYDGVGAEYDLGDYATFSGKVKKNSNSQQGSATGSEGYGLGSNPFQPSVDAATPSVLTESGKQSYKPTPYVKPATKPKTLPESVDDDNNYLGAVWNQIANSGSDFIGGMTRLIAKSNPYGSPVMAGVADELGNRASIVTDNSFRTESSSKSNEEKLQSGFDLSNGISLDDAKALPLLISRFAADAGLAIPTAGASFIAQGYNTGLKEYDKATEGQLVDQNTRELFGIGYAGINGLLDKLSLGLITKSPTVAKGIKKTILGLGIKELAKVEGKITNEIIEQTFNKVAKQSFNKIKTAGVKAFTSGAIEGSTESGQGALSDGLKLLTNKLSDKEIFNKEEIVEGFLANRLNDFGGGAILGGAMGGGVALMSSKSIIAKRVAESTTPEQLEILKNEIASEVEAGTMDADRAESLMVAVDKYAGAKKKLPTDLSTQQTEKALDTIVERDAVAETIKQKTEQAAKSDEALAPQTQQELDLLEAKRQSLNDNIVEVTTDEKFSYSVDPESGKYFKQLGEDGKPEEITEQQYKLEKQVALKVEATQETDTEQSLVEEGIELKYDDNGNPLAPNGNPSKLTDLQAKIVRTKQFKNWFKDGLLDENGEPLVVYHGSPNEFTEFKHSRDIGFHFGSKYQAEYRSAKQKVKPFFLSAKNIKEVDDVFSNGDWLRVGRELVNKNILTEKEVDYIFDNNIGAKMFDAIKSKLVEKGIDGLTYINKVEGVGERSYVVFDKNKIKLADGRNTTFNPNSNDFLEAALPNNGVSNRASNGVGETNTTFEQSTEISPEQTNLDSKPQDDLLLDGEQVTGEPTNTDTAVETDQGAGAIDQATDNSDVSEIRSEVVNDGAGGDFATNQAERVYSKRFGQDIGKIKNVGSKMLDKALESGTYFSKVLKNAVGKYIFIPISFEPSPYNGDRATYKFLPKPNENTEVTVSYRDWDTDKARPEPIIYDKTLVDENGEIINSEYKSIYDKSLEITSGDFDENHLFRGMSKAELDTSVKRGYLKSDARANLGGQENTTSFAQHAGQATNYASGFTGWHDAATFNEPKYVVKVSKKGVDFKPSIPTEIRGEVDVAGEIPVTDILEIYEIRLASAEAGTIDIREEYPNEKIIEGSRSGMSQKVVARKMNLSELNIKLQSPAKESDVKGNNNGVNTVLQKAETDLAALKQVENKTAKYEGSVKRLTEAKNAGLITESEYNDTLNRFDDVMAEYTPKGAKSVNLNESIPDEVLDDVEVPKEVKQYHAKEKDRAVADIKAQWAKLSVVGIANNPIQQDKDVAKLIEAVSRYAYHAMMDGSIKIQGKIADKVNDVINQLGLEKVTKQQREAITEAIKVQVEKTKAELKEFAKPIKTVIKESTQVKSDFKEKDLISRLSQFKRRLADEVRGFKKGVKEGKSDAKEKQQSKDDIISGLREEIKLQIKEAKDSGLISNRIKPQTFVGAINRLNNAKTPMQLLKAIDYMSRVFADIDYDNHLTEANNLRSKVKKLAKRKGLPSNISEAMRNIARAVPEDLDDLIEYNKLLNSVIDNVNGASITGIDTGLLNDVANWLAEQHQKKTKERYELLVGEQGFEYESKTLEEMKAEIDALNEEGYEGKDSRRDADEAVSELLREDLLDADVSDYDHPQEVAAIEALKSLDISELSDKDLRLYNIAVNNLMLNGKLNGIGTLISVARKQKNFADKAKIADIKATTRAVSSWADKFRSGWATLPTQLKAFINNDRNLAKFYTITGLAEIKTGYTRVSNRITEVEKGIEKIIRKHKGLRNSPKRQIEVAVYADLNQWDHGSTQEQIQEQFDGRKTALLETIDRLKEKSTHDVKFKKEHSNYIGLLEEVYDSIKDLKSVDDLKLEPDQLELYNFMRDYYDSIQDDTRLNAEIYNNINFKPVQNYFPRTYNKVDDLFGANAEKQMESKLLSESIFYDRSDIKKEESGSKQSRVIKKDQLPIDKVINLDLVSNFLNTARNVLYDIETQPARTYTANLLASKQMRELTTDDSSIEITQRVANQLVKNQRLGILPQHSKTAAKAMGEFYRGMGNRFALGGISQAVKQSASSYTTTMIALGKNAGLLATSVHELIVNNEAANRLMEGMPISRRALEKSALTHVSIKESDVSKLNRSMEKHIVRVLDGWNDFADFMSLSPLIWGDLVSAKASWMAFYKDYLIKEGIIKSSSEFDLEKESLNRNAEAAEYAEQMTNTTLNSNDRTLQPEQKLGGWFPFTSFAINAKLNLAIDMARVSRKGIPMPERQKAARMVAGHIASSVVLNTISWGLRAYLITEAVDLVANFIKDDEEEEERDVLVKYLESLQDELLVRNSENTVGYIIKDIVFGGIISQVTDPVYNTIKEWITGEKSYDRPSDLIKIAGIYGIPASAIIQLGTKANDLMLPDEKFVQERFGIESADGSMLYVPSESRDKKRSDWARKSMASATALNALQVLSSVSNQEFANISRRLPLLVKKLEDKKYGSKRSLNPKNIEKDMAEITEMGKTYVLTPEQIEFRKKAKAEFLKDNYKTIKENGTDKESEQLAKSLSDTYATNLTLHEFRDKLKEKE